MKSKILKALKIKFKNLGFSDKAFEGVADYLATTITEEDQIETGINGVEPMFKAFQGDADSRVNIAVEKAKAKKAEEGGEEDDEGDEGKQGGANPTKKKTVSKSNDDEPPAWAKGLIERLDSFEKGKVNESRQQKLEAKLEGVHDSIKNTVLKSFKHAKFDKDEDFDAYLNEIGETVESANQTLESSGLGATKPLFGAADSKTGVSSSVQNFIESKKNATGGELAGKEI
ncbi:hypothetical protein [Albibacterium profundi]|uniref:Uncharacterized protein n=1 Tax=Albibacterium profundi TaxID=3134906 RepID=A0ABV5CFL2_9SPHI